MRLFGRAGAPAATATAVASSVAATTTATSVPSAGTNRRQCHPAHSNGAFVSRSKQSQSRRARAVGAFSLVNFVLQFIISDRWEQEKFSVVPPPPPPRPPPLRSQGFPPPQLPPPPARFLPQPQLPPVVLSPPRSSLSKDYQLSVFSPLSGGPLSCAARAENLHRYDVDVTVDGVQLVRIGEAGGGVVPPASMVRCAERDDAGHLVIVTRREVPPHTKPHLGLG